MAGLFFEEFEEGQVFEHAVSRTVTEMDNVLFSALTMNPQPLHLELPPTRQPCRPPEDAYTEPRTWCTANWYARLAIGR